MTEIKPNEEKAVDSFGDHDSYCWRFYCKKCEQFELPPCEGFGHCDCGAEDKIVKRTKAHKVSGSVVP